MSFAPQFRMSAGGESGQKGPAVSAQEAQMQAIMQQARVPVLLLLKYLVNSFNAICFPCFSCTPVYILNVHWSQCWSSASACHAWPLRSNGFDRQTRSSGTYIYLYLQHLVSLLWLKIVSHVLFLSSGSSWCNRTEGRERRGGSSGATFINRSQNGQHLWTSIGSCSAAALNNAYHFSMIVHKWGFKVTPLSLIPSPICFRDHVVLWDPLAPLENLAEE